MKLPPRDTAKFLNRPQPAKAAILLYGEDSVRVALARSKLVTALVGANAAQDMRLDRIAAIDIRKEPAPLIDSLKAQGFFPGPRAVLVEDATESSANALGLALKEWRDGDATLVVTAGALKPTNALRKLFESAPNAWAVAIYSDPPGQDEIARDLAKAGLTNIAPDAMTLLLNLGRDLDPGDFGQFVVKLALYKIGDASPVSAADVLAVVPATIEAELDDAIRAVAEGRVDEVVPQLQRLAGQGTQPATLCAGIGRHFRQIHAATCQGSGDQAGSARFGGPKREQLANQARIWGTERAERALEAIIETELALRSPRPVPAHALVERACIRIAMLCPK